MLRNLILGGLSLCLAGSVWADTVVLKNGRRYSGEVTKTAEGYDIRTKLGVMRVAEADFAELIVGDTPAAAASTVVKPQPMPAKPVPADTHTAPAKPAGSVQQLVGQGQAALLAGDFKGANKFFADAVAIDPKNALALHGLGASFMYGNDFLHAGPVMEKAIAAAGTPDRALVLNMAVCQIGLKNPIRGCKMIRDYLTSHPQQLDEPMLNALGTAMSLASDTSKRQSFFQELVKFYLGYNVRLEKEKPGYRRWGVEWLPVSEVGKRESDYVAAEKTIGQIGVDLDALDEKIALADKDYQYKFRWGPKGFFTNSEIEIAHSKLLVLEDQVKKKNDEYEAAVGQMKSPTFPLTMSLVRFDEQSPPTVGGATLLASASSDTEPPRKKPARPRSKPADSTAKPNTGEAPPPNSSEPPPIQIVMAPTEKKPVSKQTLYAVAFPVSPELVVTVAAIAKDTKDIGLQTIEGDPVAATVVKVDEACGLALLRVTGKRLAPLSIGTEFNGGAIGAIGFPTPSLFNPTPEKITGQSNAPSAGWRINLSQNPRLPGAPLLVEKKVVGISLVGRDMDEKNGPAVTLDELKKFLSSDVAPVESGAEPTVVLLQVQATREIAP